MNPDFPQNYIIRHPFSGALIFAAMTFLFLWFYRPLDVGDGVLQYYGLTMALYCMVSGLAVYASVRLLVHTRWFAPPVPWTIGREFGAIILILTVTGNVVYFAGFLLEPSIYRWNFLTLADSLLKTYLIGVIPFLIPTGVNLYIRYFLRLENGYDELTSGNPGRAGGRLATGEQRPPDRPAPDDEPSPTLESSPSSGTPIEIDTPLKNEELRFLPNEFVYATAEGNYVIFHLLRGGRMRKVIVRCTLSSIEEQLSAWSRFMRVHRAYIINLDKILRTERQSFGLQLILDGTDTLVPVSKSRVSTFRKAERSLRSLP